MDAIPNHGNHFGLELEFLDCISSGYMPFFDPPDQNGVEHIVLSTAGYTPFHAMLADIRRLS